MTELPFKLTSAGFLRADPSAIPALAYEEQGAVWEDGLKVCGGFWRVAHKPQEIRKDGVS